MQGLVLDDQLDISHPFITGTASHSCGSDTHTKTQWQLRRGQTKKPDDSQTCQDRSIPGVRRRASS